MVRPCLLLFATSPPLRSQRSAARGPYHIGPNPLGKAGSGYQRLVVWRSTSSSGPHAVLHPVTNKAIAIAISINACFISCLLFGDPIMRIQTRDPCHSPRHERSLQVFASCNEKSDAHDPHFASPLSPGLKKTAEREQPCDVAPKRLRARHARHVHAHSKPPKKKSRPDLAVAVSLGRRVSGGCTLDHFPVFELAAERVALIGTVGKASYPK